jgi:hypothetical protein
MINSTTKQLGTVEVDLADVDLSQCRKSGPYYAIELTAIITIDHTTDVLQVEVQCQGKRCGRMKLDDGDDV